MSYASSAKKFHNKYLISVILPAYNAEEYIYAAIDSILQQTYTNFELIVINDASTDHTEEIILSFSDKRIRYIKNEQNLKLIKTLNKGIALANGKYIARMDADDISMPNRFQIEYEFMENHQDISVCSGLIYRFYNKKVYKSSYYSGLAPEGCNFCSIYRTPHAHPTAFFASEVLKQFMYTDSNSAYAIEDFVLWGDMAIAGVKMSVINERLLYYRDNNHSISHTNNGIQVENHKVRVRYMLKHMLSLDISDEILATMYDFHPKSFVCVLKTLSYIDKSKDVYIVKKGICTKLEKKDINKAAYNIKRGTLAGIFRRSAGVKKFNIILLLLLITLKLK